MSDLERLLDQLDLVVGLADGNIGEADLLDAARRASRARDHAGYVGSTLVMALLGGTGVGKSSLLNAIAGEQVASTSIVRPHTTRPLAWVPDDAELSLGRLLDELGITDRVDQSRLPGIAIIDMTDIDSLEPRHRQIVEEMLPRIDVAVWVLDPVKYADADLHEGFIAPAAVGSDRLVFVLNRIDTVTPDRLDTVLGHAADLLREDGIDEPTIIATAAEPYSGEPVGIGDLVEYLVERLEEKRIRLGRVVEDARWVGRTIADTADVASGGSTGFDVAWTRLCEAAAENAARGFSMGEREQLILDTELLVAEISTRAGPVLGPELRRAMPPRTVEDGVRAALRRAGRQLGVWRVPIDADLLVQGLNTHVGDAVRLALHGRAALAAALAGLSVGAASVSERLSRR